MKIFLTKRATNKFNSIKEHIAEEWRELVANAFEQKLLTFLHETNTSKANLSPLTVYMQFHIRIYQNTRIYVGDC